MATVKGKTNSGLVKYAIAQLGLPYWYGTFGQTATASLYASKQRQYPDFYASWSDFPAQYGQRVHDCVGLIKGYLWSSSPTAVPKFNSAQDRSACGMYSASSLKGAISGFPAHPGQLVYKSSKKDDPKKIHHVGVYIGNGYVVEAKGHEYGVVKTKFDGAGWTHWSQCPYIVDDSGEPRIYSKDKEGAYRTTGNVYIREGAGTSRKALGVLQKGTDVNCFGCFTRVSGTEWLLVSVSLNGKPAEGWVSGKYLKKL